MILSGKYRHKTHAIKTKKALRCANPEITVAGLRERLNATGRKSLLRSPIGEYVLLQTRIIGLCAGEDRPRKSDQRDEVDLAPDTQCLKGKTQNFSPPLQRRALEEKAHNHSYKD